MTQLAMFPLGTVLFPHAGLPLHVFEPRYRALMRDCLAGDRQFGVVLIERGSEVGGDDARFGVGTVAHIVETAEFPDGRWLLLAAGGHRMRVDEWLPDAPYPRAEVTHLDDPAWQEDHGELLRAAETEVRRALAYASELGEPAVPATFELAGDPAGQEDHGELLRAAETEVRRALAYASELGEPAVPATFELAGDPAVAMWQLAAASPLGPADKQRLLELERHRERLVALADLVRDQAEVLAYRLSG
jgi:Lon protease-like protein